MKRIIIFSAITMIVAGIIFSFRNSNNKIQKSPDHNQESNASTTTVQSSIIPYKISAGNTPNIPLVLPSDFTIHIFADGVENARDLQFSPEGTLLVSSPSTGSVYALPDRNGDGMADSKKKIVLGKNNPHGLAFYKNNLYVAEVDKVVKYSWDEGNLVAKQTQVLFPLPQNNNHNKRTIAFDESGKIYVSVGSTCNVCSESSDLSATVLTADADGTNLKVFATGLRNAPFMQFNPKTQELWVTEMGRDNLGDNTPPDEINIIKLGKNYGWPNCYGDKIVDLSFNPSASCQSTEAPTYQIPAHSAPLGLAFIMSKQFQSQWQGDLLVAYHGSWNRSVPTGYKVVRLKLNDSSIAASEDFLTGFLPLSAKSGSDAKGRPVDLIFDAHGNLYLSDDKAGKVYIIQKQKPR